jgi:acetyl esterase
MPLITLTDPYSSRRLSVEPASRSFLETLGEDRPPIASLPLQVARAALTSEQSLTVFNLPADTRDHSIDAGSAGILSLRIVRPQGCAEALPAILYFHGGGWVLGDRETHDRLIRELAEAAHAAVVFVDYTPSPEATFPAAIEQAYFATGYVAERGRELNLDGSRIAVAGDSAGGNIAAAVTLLAKQRRGPAILFQTLFYPVTDAACESDSYIEFASGPWLTKQAMLWFWNSYTPDASDRTKITASPLRATADELKGLPPALVITSDNDVLRDEGEAYASRLHEAGVRVTAVRFLGTIHDFVMLNALADSPAARGAVALAGAMLRSAFAR